MLKLFDPRRYLFFKIFVWFWLTLIATLTLLIVLSNFSPNQVDAEPLKGHRLKNIQHLAKSLNKAIKKRPEKSLKQLLSHPRLAQHKLLYVRSNDENGFFNRKKTPRIDTNLLSFSYQLKPQRIITKEFYAAGPVTLKYGDKQYQLYEIERLRHTPISFRLVLMPMWQKVLIGLVASLGLSLVFSRMLIKPINALKQGTTALANGKFKTRILNTSTRGDELSILAHDFNAMADKLESLMHSQKRLLADVSHELRSPLTRLQMAAALAQMNKDDTLDGHLMRIEQEANNLDAMIADVLKLSRLEIQNQYINKDHNNLKSIIDQVISNAQFEATQLGKSVTSIGDANITIEVDPALIASAIENILRNAIKYANQSVVVEVKINSEITIAITDDGNGVNEHHLAHLFEPFYRVSDSRTRNTGGSGLGLAIAKHAIEAHDGRVNAQLAKPSGLTMLISLPMSIIADE